MNRTVRAIVEREVGRPPDRVAEASEGLLHETYVVGCGDAEYVLQFATGEGDRADSLARGLGCYVLLQDSAVPVPEPVTESVREFEGRRYSLVERCPGENAERNVTPSKTRDAGRVLADVHDARAFESAGWLAFRDGTPGVEEFSEGTLANRIRHRVERTGRTLERAGLSEVSRGLVALFDRRGGDLPTDFRPVLCHNDYSPDNVLFRDEAVTCVVDFDRACASHRVRDVVAAANAFWMHDPTAEWNVRQELYEGYRAGADLPPDFERVEPLYRVETLAGTVAGLLELGELSASEREFYEDRLERELARAD